MIKKSFLTLAVLLSITSSYCYPAETRSVTDDLGRNIFIKESPQRIVSLAPGITETLYAMNLADKIVGVTSFCNWPAAAKQKQRIGGFINPSIEKIK